MDNSTKNPQQDTPKAFDIFRPGKTPPSATSRPVIAGQHPPVHDSTLTEKPPAEPVQHDRQLMSPHEKITIQPPADTEAAQAESAPATGVPDQQQSPREVEPTPPIAGNEPPTGLAGHPSSAIAEPSTTPGSQPPEKSQIADYTAASDEPLPPESAATVDPAQIVISHHTGTGKRRWLRISFMILLVLVVAAITVDIVLDTGLWNSAPNIPHTHLFKTS
jgi:hypothetical protein